jgi:hypothetical protein
MSTSNSNINLNINLNIKDEKKAAAQLASFLSQLKDPNTAGAVLKNLTASIEIIDAARTILSADMGNSKVVSRVEAFLLRDAFNISQASKKASRQPSPSQEA